MRLSLRSHIIFVIGLLTATFGTGQLWSLASSLRGGSVSFGDIVAGGLGFFPLMVASLVVGRLLYLQVYVSRLYQAQKQEVYDDSHR